MDRRWKPCCRISKYANIILLYYIWNQWVITVFPGRWAPAIFRGAALHNIIHRVMASAHNPAVLEPRRHDYGALVHRFWFGTPRALNSLKVTSTGGVSAATVYSQHSESKPLAHGALVLYRFRK